MMDRWIASSVLVLLGAACHGCANLPATPSSSHSTPVPVILSAIMTGSVIPRGADATISFAIENHGTTDLELTFPSSCDILPYIKQRDAMIYPAGGWGCATVITHLTVPAGGAATRDVRLRAAPTAEYPVVALGVGDYVAYATVDSSTYHLTSPLVGFTVQ
jgi:hypothetical protein